MNKAVVTDQSLTELDGGLARALLLHARASIALITRRDDHYARKANRILNQIENIYIKSSTKEPHLSDDEKVEIRESQIPFVMMNGLTETETTATASVAGLTQSRDEILAEIAIKDQEYRRGQALGLDNLKDNMVNSTELARLRDDALQMADAIESRDYAAACMLKRLSSLVAGANKTVLDAQKKIARLQGLADGYAQVCVSYRELLEGEKTLRETDTAFGLASDTSGTAEKDSTDTSNAVRGSRAPRAQEARYLLILASGEYCDYNWNGPYRPLRQFTMAEALAAFKAQWKPGNEWSVEPSPDEFSGWLCSEGWIEEVERDEVHVGCYGRIELSEHALSLTFAPPAVQPAGVVPTSLTLTPAFADCALPATVQHELWEQSAPKPGQSSAQDLTWQLGTFARKLIEQARAVIPEMQIASSANIHLPHPGSIEVSALLDSILAEYNWPSNSKNAARAGWTAAMRYLQTASKKVSK